MANILVVDNDRVFSHLLANLLRGKGHKVLSAIDAVQAAMLAMKSPPDAIILAINMPGGSGEDCMHKLKMSSRTSQIPIIVLSGSTDTGVRKKLPHNGAAATLSKPLVPSDLFAALETIL
jgi:DNA-binding response OmpR family regulator